jgi:glycosyltransferase involved in cell wall biosynthesis
LRALPRLSAAIVTYNRARYLPRAIESVLDQTYRDLELIVVDDGSTDDTVEAIAPYGDRIRYVRQENQGKAAARNRAVCLADGELVAFCDSDDSWVPDRIERQVRTLDEHPEAGMVHGHIEVVDEFAQVLPAQTAAHRALLAGAHRHGATYAGYAVNCCCFSSTILVRREVFDAVGLYDPELEIEDYDFYLRLVLDFPVEFLDGPPLARYRLHDGQTPDEHLGLGQIHTAEKHLALLAERPGLPDARAARRNFHLMIARSWRALGDRRHARAAAVRAMRFGSVRALRFAL